ncbi:MAG: YicC/YloC family endoribonuclease [Gammaproteobacteria bacterium]
MSTPTAERRPLQSMTGYAVAGRETPAGQVSVELRSVNSRYLDLSMRMPDELRAAEAPLRELIGIAVQRGKLECRVGLRTAAGAPSRGALDAVALEALSALDARVRAALPQAAPLTVGDALRWPGVLAEQASIESLLPAILDAARDALADFVATRVREGVKLAMLIAERADAIDAIAIQVAERAPELLALHEQKLVERLRDALEAAGAGVPMEETMARVRQEVILHGMRIDIDEEVGRLRAHVGELRRILAGPGPVGKRMDFLLQEFNREANTIASKASALDLTHAAVDLKLLVEQIREQVQNIE